MPGSARLKPRPTSASCWNGSLEAKRFSTGGGIPSEGREAARHSAIVGVTKVSSQRDNIMVCGYFVPTRDASRARVVRRALTVFPGWNPTTLNVFVRVALVGNCSKRVRVRPTVMIFASGTNGLP